MICPGLLSVTFRKLSTTEIIALASDAGLQSVEWGGDVHVPHGNIAIATEVSRQTADVGLQVSAYGSYYRAAKQGELEFEAVLDSTSALKTKIVRIWAGTVGSRQATPEHRAAVVDDIARCCDLAASRDITVAMEFHGGTLSDDVDSALTLVEAVNRSNFGTFWQPPVAMEPLHVLNGLRRMLPHVLNLHVFHWWPDSQTRLPLSDGQIPWSTYLELAATSPRIRHASLEFVQGDDVSCFRRDARTLRDWLSAGNAQLFDSSSFPNMKAQA